MGADSILQALANPTPDTRPRYTFDVPEDSRVYETDPKTITFVPIRVRDEQDAVKLAETGKNLGDELLRRSVVALDDKPVDWNTGGDGWIERVSPKTLELARLGYQDVNENRPSAKVGFLGSKRVAV